jgi:hypothetical protein
MRNTGLFTLLILLPACKAQGPDAGVVDLVKQMERTLQTGDRQGWAALHDAPTREKLAGGRDLPPRVQPTIRVQPTKILVQGDKAAVIVAMSDPGNPKTNASLSLRLVREGSAWKIAEEMGNNPAPDPDSIYALLPPESGSFSRAGSHWEGIARAAGNTKYFTAEQLRWKLQGVFDESFLYVRIESGGALPAANSDVQGEFPNLKLGFNWDWPTMKIRVTGAKNGEFTFDASPSIGDQATFDKQGKANSHRHYIAYLLNLRGRGDNYVFHAETGLEASPLIEVHERFLDLKIPLKTIGVDAAGVQLEIADANSPGKILPYPVRRYLQ